MEKQVNPGIYQHYKGNLYHVLEVGRHSETLDLLVVYRALYGTHGLWVRPLELFHDNVIIDGVSQPRFTFLHKCEVSEVDPNR